MDSNDVRSALAATLNPEERKRFHTDPHFAGEVIQQQQDAMVRRPAIPRRGPSATAFDIMGGVTATPEDLKRLENRKEQR